jgi:hypothetical protein
MINNSYINGMPATAEMRWEVALQAAIFAVEELIKLVGYKEDEIDVDENEITAHTEAFVAAMQDMEDIQQNIDQATADRDDDFWYSTDGENVSEIIDFDFSDHPDFEDLDSLIFMSDCLSDVGGFTFPADLKLD